jgi:branched-chain amino acid transport system substrate-binding protein
MVFSKKERENKSNRKTLFWNYARAALFFLVFAGTLLAATSQQASADHTITIAIVGPMAGDNFSVGLQYNVGVTAAVQTLPGGLLLGKELNIKTYDDKCSTPVAEKVALDLITNPPAVVIGHSCSMATLAAAPVYARHKILQITPASTNPQITALGIRTIFRMIGRDDLQSEIAAERITAYHAGKKIGVFYFPGNYSEGLARNAINAFEKRGIKPVYTGTGIASASSYADNIQDIIDAGVEVLYLTGGGLDSGIFMRQARQMDAPFSVIGSDPLVSKIFIETAGSAGEGIPFTFPPEAAKLSTSKQAVDAIKELGQEPVGYTLLAYAAAETWIEGVRRANSFDADLVAAAIRQAPVKTIMGQISFDAKGDIHTNYPPFSWNIWKEGKRVPLD